MTKEKKGYIRTEFGTIPEDWNYEPLENFFSYISYGFTNPMPTTENGVYMITAADISNGEIQYEEARHTSKWAFDNLLTQKSRPQINDILLTKDGTLGRVALVDRKNICINQSVAVIRPNDRIEPLFLKYLLEGPVYQKIMIQNAGGSTIKHLYITKVNLMKIGVPFKKEEQHAIASALSDVDELIRSLDGLIQKKQAIKKGTVQQLLSGKKRLPGFDGKWEMKQLGDVCQIISGGTPSTRNSEYWDGDIKWCTPTDITSNNGKYFSKTSRKITKQGLNNSSATLLPKGTLLLCSRATVGEVKIATIEISTNQGFKSLICSETVDNEFLYYLIRLEKQKFIDKAFGSTFLEISKKNTSEIEFDFPPIEEQKAIAQILSDMDRELQTLRQKRKKYVQIKQGMMQELLTGKTRLL